MSPGPGSRQPLPGPVVHGEVGRQDPDVAVFLHDAPAGAQPHEPLGDGVGRLGRHRHLEFYPALTAAQGTRLPCSS